MLNALRVIWKAMRQMWDDMLPLVLMNLFTIACQVVIIPGPGAWMALNAVCNRSANEFAFSWEHYWAAFRTHVWRAWKYALPANVISVLIVLNFFWYPSTFGREDWVVWVQGAWLAAGLFWIILQFYVAAFFTEQEVKSWKTALRNTAVVAGANPLFTLTLVVVTVAVLIVSLVLVPPLIAFLGLAWWAMVGNSAVVDRVKAFKAREEAEQQKKATPRRPR